MIEVTWPEIYIQNKFNDTVRSIAACHIARKHKVYWVCIAYLAYGLNTIFMESYKNSNSKSDGNTISIHKWKSLSCYEEDYNGFMKKIATFNHFTYKKLEKFFHRIAFNLGNSCSQTDVRILSCIPVDIVELQNRIQELENKLSSSKKVLQETKDNYAETDIAIRKSEINTLTAFITSDLTKLTSIKTNTIKPNVKDRSIQSKKSSLTEENEVIIQHNTNGANLVSKYKLFSQEKKSDELFHKVSKSTIELTHSKVKNNKNSVIGKTTLKTPLKPKSKKLCFSNSGSIIRSKIKRKYLQKNIKTNYLCSCNNHNVYYSKFEPQFFHNGYLRKKSCSNTSSEFCSSYARRSTTAYDSRNCFLKYSNDALYYRNPAPKHYLVRTFSDPVCNDEYDDSTKLGGTNTKIDDSSAESIIYSNVYADEKFINKFPGRVYNDYSETGIYRNNNQKADKSKLEKYIGNYNQRKYIKSKYETEKIKKLSPKMVHKKDQISLTNGKRIPKILQENTRKGKQIKNTNTNRYKSNHETEGKCSKQSSYNIDSDNNIRKQSINSNARKIENRNKILRTYIVNKSDSVENFESTNILSQASLTSDKTKSICCLIDPEDIYKQGKSTLNLFDGKLDKKGTVTKSNFKSISLQCSFNSEKYLELDKTTSSFKINCHCHRVPAFNEVINSYLVDLIESNNKKRLDEKIQCKMSQVTVRKDKNVELDNYRRDLNLSILSENECNIENTNMYSIYSKNIFPGVQMANHKAIQVNDSFTNTEDIYTQFYLSYPHYAYHRMRGDFYHLPNSNLDYNSQIQYPYDQIQYINSNIFDEGFHCNNVYLRNQYEPWTYWDYNSEQNNLCMVETTLSENNDGRLINEKVKNNNIELNIENILPIVEQHQSKTIIQRDEPVLDDKIYNSIENPSITQYYSEDLSENILNGKLESINPCDNMNDNSLLKTSKVFEINTLSDETNLTNKNISVTIPHTENSKEGVRISRSTPDNKQTKHFFSNIFFYCKFKKKLSKCLEPPNIQDNMLINQRFSDIPENVEKANSKQTGNSLIFHRNNKQSAPIWNVFSEEKGFNTAQSSHESSIFNNSKPSSKNLKSKGRRPKKSILLRRLHSDLKFQDYKNQQQNKQFSMNHYHRKNRISRTKSVSWSDLSSSNGDRKNNFMKFLLFNKNNRKKRNKMCHNKEIQTSPFLWKKRKKLINVLRKPNNNHTIISKETAVQATNESRFNWKNFNLDKTPQKMYKDDRYFKSKSFSFKQRKSLPFSLLPKLNFHRNSPFNAIGSKYF